MEHLPPIYPLVPQHVLSSVQLHAARVAARAPQVPAERLRSGLGLRLRRTHDTARALLNYISAALSHPPRPLHTAVPNPIFLLPDAVRAPLEGPVIGTPRPAPPAPEPALEALQPGLGCFGAPPPLLLRPLLRWVLAQRHRNRSALFAPHPNLAGPGKTSWPGGTSGASRDRAGPRR